MVTARQIAERAYELLRDGQWAQGVMRLTSSPFHGCVLGAVGVAARELLGFGEDSSTMSLKTAPSVEVVDELVRVIKRRTALDPVVGDATAPNTKWWVITRWNDAYCQSTGEAVDVLKEAAVNLPLEAH